MAVETMKVNIYYSRECASVQKQGKLAWVAELTKMVTVTFIQKRAGQLELLNGNMRECWETRMLITFRLHCDCTVSVNTTPALI